MASRSARAASLRLSEVEAATDEAARYVNVCLVLRRRNNGEDLLEVGGKWDRVEQRYVGEASRRHIIYINEAQVDLAIALKEWLEKRIAGADREIIQFAGVKRGGGKTHWFVVALAVVAIALPGAVTWAVSPTHPKRDEIERIIRGQIPKGLGWWMWRGQPDFRYTWITGSVLRLLSGEVPQTVKQGGVEAAFINEAQDQDRRVFSLGLPAIRNNDGRPAGIMFLAANPPERVRGEWVNDLVEKLKTKQIDGRYFDVDPALNQSIEQAPLDKVEHAVTEVDPEAAKRDLGGNWLPIGERAYPMWRSRRREIDGEFYDSLVGEIDIGSDVTAECFRRLGYVRSSGRPTEWAIGGDFQGRPHMAALGCKIYRRPSDGKFVYYFRYEFTPKGSEFDLSEDIVDGGVITPENAAFIADASGEWQAGKNRRIEPPSWQALKAERWVVFPPREKLRPESKYASNPQVDVSLGQMFIVMREGRILVHPDCKWLALAFEKCPLKREGPKAIIPPTGGFSHITDCARYIVFRFEPKPKRVGGAPRGESFRDQRPGAGFQYT